MTTFIWRDTLTISVSEMNRAQALDACRQFDLAAKVFSEDVELFREVDVIAVLNAPVVVKIDNQIVTAGERVVTVGEEEPFMLALPLTHENFYALPMSLTELWIQAAAQSNEWLLVTLKKTLDLTTVLAPALRYVNALSLASKAPAPLTTTTGE